MNKIALAGLIVSIAPMIAAAQPYRPQLDQDIAVSSIPVYTPTIGTTFAQVDTPKLDGSFAVAVQNLSTEQICCTFDTTQAGAATNACVRLDTASTAARATVTDWKRWKRWAQNLSLFCRSLKGAGGTASIIVTQER